MTDPVDNEETPEEEKDDGTAAWYTASPQSVFADPATVLRLNTELDKGGS